VAAEDDLVGRHGETRSPKSCFHRIAYDEHVSRPGGENQSFVHRLDVAARGLLSRPLLFGTFSLGLNGHREDAADGRTNINYLM
jgi:hypothetical protein